MKPAMASRTPNAIHKWLNVHYPRKRVCEQCGKKDCRTDYAFRFHPRQHTRNRDHYLELCVSCHMRMDGKVPVVTQQNAMKTHCKRNHPLSGDNLLKSAKGRECKMCKRLRTRQYREKV